MARISPVTNRELQPPVQVGFERHIKECNSNISNMKATLGHSLLAFEIYMQWYPLYEQVQKILGKRMAYIFAYAISKEAKCQLCTAFFRKTILDAREDPDNLSLTASQKDVLNFACSIVKHHGNINDYLYNAVAERFSEAEMVVLIAFAGQMIATNIFNNVAETDIDGYLVDYANL
jgi:hypothetical protein